MPFDISVTREFAAAHQLRLYDGALEPLHGHNWRVCVVVSATALDSIGTVMDFHQLEHLLEAIIEPLHNHNLNDISPFAADMNPSTENVALHIAQSLQLPPSVRLTRVEVWETSTCSAVYRPR
jgi:6-pyruvoyltetrahydropterin/6-carboxytetrahydropterin synthase